MKLFKSHLSFALAAAAICVPALGHAQESRGVNPADIDSRFDLIYKRVNLSPEGKVDTWTLKYDYKLNNQWGLNFELPVTSKLSAPGLTASGNGDVFARARWIVPGSDGLTYGLSFETVLPAASKDALGTGKYQLNVAGLVVKAWSRSFLTAVALKQITSVAGDSDRAKFSNTEIRLVPVWILQDGWAVTGELRQTWEHRSDQNWQRAELTLNKQFNLQWAGSVGYSRDFGDKKDKGAIGIAAKYFF